MSISEYLKDGVSFNVTCRNSECKGTFEETLYDFDGPECIDEDREMGAEYEYSKDQDVKCPHCGCEFEIRGLVYEYPEGAYNSEDLEYLK